MGYIITDFKGRNKISLVSELSTRRNCNQLYLLKKNENIFNVIEKLFLKSFNEREYGFVSLNLRIDCGQKVADLKRMLKWSKHFYLLLFYKDKNSGEIKTHNIPTRYSYKTGVNIDGYDYVAIALVPLSKKKDIKGIKSKIKRSAEIFSLISMFH